MIKQVKFYNYVFTISKNENKIGLICEIDKRTIDEQFFNWNKPLNDKKIIEIENFIRNQVFNGTKPVKATDKDVKNIRKALLKEVK